eukprot:3063381-Pyramimonas_sp.AAC.1
MEWPTFPSSSVGPRRNIGAIQPPSHARAHARERTPRQRGNLSALWPRARGLVSSRGKSAPVAHLFNAAAVALGRVGRGASTR